MKNWAMVLHMYQPITQNEKIVFEVYKKNYGPLIKLLKETSQVKLTLNISGSLTILLKEHGYTDFLDDVRKLAQSGQIELLTSPLYHPFLPLLHEDVIQRQIEYSTSIIQDCFGVNPQGIYPPELALNSKILAQFSDLGYQYTIADETSLNKNYELGSLPSNQTFLVDNFRVAITSRTITEVMRAYYKELEVNQLTHITDRFSGESSLISVNDAELFGHHYEHRLKTLAKLFNSTYFKFITLSEALEQEGGLTIEASEFVTSTWETSLNQIEEGNYFPLWDKHGNHLQKLYQDLGETAYAALKSIPKPKPDHGLKYASAEKHYDQGISSCHLYWLSNHPWWHPNLVEEGAQHLIRCVRALPVSNAVKIEAEKKYITFLETLWTYHWSEKPQKGYDDFDIIRKQRISALENLIENETT